MCNAYELRVKWLELVRTIQVLELGIPTQQTGLDLRVADDVRINDMGSATRATANNNEMS